MNNSNGMYCGFSVSSFEDIFSELEVEWTSPRAVEKTLKPTSHTTSYDAIAAVVEEMLGEYQASEVLNELTNVPTTDESKDYEKTLRRMAKNRQEDLPEADARTKIILVDTNLERRIETGYILEALGYRVFAAATIDTIVRYPSLYKDCTHLAHGEGYPDEVIMDLWAKDFENALIPVSLDISA